MVHRQVEEIAAFRRSKSVSTVASRCQMCGAPSQGTEEAIEAGRGPSVGVELDAILMISQALTRLQDDERQRVLQWATDRFGQRAIAKPVTPAIVALPDLRTDDLHDLFGAPAVESPHASELGADDELGDLFEEAAIATESLVELDVPVSLPVPVPVDQHQPPLQIAEAPLDALVADFVSEFRRLAVECQGS
jgi:hypothetical protein